MACNIPTIVKAAIKQLRTTLPASIEIVLQLEDQFLAINGDPTEIHQLIVNLCTNGVQAMMESDGVLLITMDRIDVSEQMLREIPELTEGQHLILTVTDSGSGISPEVMEHIFEPFFTTKRLGNGTGLGLAIVHGIVKGLAGSIQVSSEPGEGTSFKVYIPLVEHIESEVTGRNGETPRGSERVLLVDDEQLIVKALAEALRNLGYSVEAFVDSKKALEAFLNTPNDYDLIITDQSMENLSGVQLAELVLAEHPDQAIILCTGFSLSISREDALEMGIAAYLDKPVSISDMATTVRRVLDSSSSNTSNLA